MKWNLRKIDACGRAELLIQKSLDLPLSASERARLDRHLIQCDSCRTAWDEYRRLGRTASEWMEAAAYDPGDAFTRNILAELGITEEPGIVEQPRRSRTENIMPGLRRTGVPIVEQPRRSRTAVGHPGLTWATVCVLAVVVLALAGNFAPAPAHIASNAAAYLPALSMTRMPSPAALASGWTPRAAELDALTDAVRTWTWPLYAFVLALAGNLALLAQSARRRGRAS